jgi:hypothetical protein
MLPSTAKRIFLDGRATVMSWAEYKHQTGRLPWHSITVHALNWVVILPGGVFLIWWGTRNRWSKGNFLVAWALVGLPYLVLWSWLSGRAKLNQIRSARRLARTKGLR